MKIRALMLGILFSMGGVAAMSAQDKEVIKGFSGGMMVHSGYQYGCDNPFGLNISSPTFGIGGCAKLHFSEHFRAGFEGYFSTAPIKRGVVSGSHNKLFWTGLLADWFFQRGKFIPYVGATLGGGMETSFFMFEGDKHDWVEEGRTVLHKQPFIPFAFGIKVSRITFRRGRN